MASEAIDYERKYQEDLERAQALSLESLALEEFRNKKRLQELHISNHSNNKATKSVSRTSSMNENDSNRNERLQVKSRPRPGCVNSSGITQSLIAPPPTAQRRNSTVTAPSDESSADLISFTSPPRNNEIIDICQQLYNNMNKQIANTSSILPILQTPLVIPTSLQNTAANSQSPFQFPQNGVYRLPQTTPPIGWNNSVIFGTSNNVMNTSLTGSFSNSNIGMAGVSMSNQSTSSSLQNEALYTVPALPPKNQTIHAPPLPTPSTSSHSSIRHRKTGSVNLIDLTPNNDDKNSVRVSILEAFDPLSNNSSYSDSIIRTISPECSMDDSVSVCDSIYEEYDPYDFIYSGSGSNSLSDPIYAAVVRSENAPTSPPPPLPPRSSTMKRQFSKDPWLNRFARLYDCIKEVDKRNPSYSPDLKAFHKMVQDLRNEFKWDSPDTNMGLVVSPMVESRYKEDTSIKVTVYGYFEGADPTKPRTFTCDVTSSVQHVTLQLIYDFDAPATDNYTLKVWGYNEYLAPTTLLSQYEYVHNCIKLDDDVTLILIPDKAVDKSLRRTKNDDVRDQTIRIEDIIPCEPNIPITNESLKILLETFEKEVDKTVNAAAMNEKGIYSSIQPHAVIQSVKAVVQLMGSLETLEIDESVQTLKETCDQFAANPVTRLNTRNGKAILETIQDNCEKIREALKGLIKMYSQAFQVDFELINHEEERMSIYSVVDVKDSVHVRLCAIYRPSPEWTYDNYMIAVQIYHGTRPRGAPLLTQPFEISDSMNKRIVFNCWLDMQIEISNLAREARLVFVIYGRTLSESQEGNDKEPMPQYKQEEIGWAAVQFFDFHNIMVQGDMLLSIWPKESSHIYGPAPSPGTYPFSDHPVLGVQLMGPSKTIFPPVDHTDKLIIGDFNSLDLQTQQQLMSIAEQDMLYKWLPEDREVLWEKRHYLFNYPNILPKVLLAADKWDWATLSDLHGMLSKWKAMKPIEAIQLLLPTFPDMEVRKFAVNWLDPLGSDELVDYLPQLVVALRHETYESSPLARFLLSRALTSPRVAHHLFWLLSHNLPGPMPQNYSFDAVDKEAGNISEMRHHRRLVLMLRALLSICGEALQDCFISQQFLVKELHEIAVTVQKTKEAHRISTLTSLLKNVHQVLEERHTSLPLSPTLQVSGINAATCSYFPSNTLPLKINFIAKDGSSIPAIFKVGDELQQDMLTLQMVRLMDKLWLKEGLDLKMVAYACVPTGRKRGMIELVSKAETLRKIQVEHGLTGSFKDKPIAEWLAKHNPTELEYSRAVENFTDSCAGYCVVTYILGICDRHNDNIMLKTSGHLFHIDFGKFLGDAQMFGNFKRDRSPFVLTSDMAYVINGGDRPSEKFHKFVDLCCQAFNIVRENGNLFLYLFTLMASSGIKGVTTEAVQNLHNALLLDKSKPEAAAYFARLIESALKSWFTQFNFFLHNLAQLKFTGDHGDGVTLSFVPTTYTMESEGKLSQINVVGFEKRYDPDKYYVYKLQIIRQNQPQSMLLLRTYKEFCELHQKLCLNFPLAKLHSLSSGLHVGRSNVKQVAHKRYQDISLFLKSLVETADEIAHSDLVYTFFHPILRDQQIPDQFSKKIKDRRVEEKNVGMLKGQLKLSIHFNRDSFWIMVHHARGLPLIGNTQEPSTYVKVYLLPDRTKETKRKTKVVKRNCHPSFMEMIQYRMSLDIISNRTLTATVWNYDALQENEFLGGVELELNKFDLRTEITEWFPLVNIRR